MHYFISKALAASGRRALGWGEESHKRTVEAGEGPGGAIRHFDSLLAVDLKEDGDYNKAEE